MTGAGALFLQRRFFIAVSAASVLFVAAYFIPVLLAPVRAALAVLALAAALDILLLFRAGGVDADRSIPEKLSNGDENGISVRVDNRYPFRVTAGVIDELPFQFQRRDFFIRAAIPPRGSHRFAYSVRPVERGEYEFGSLNIYVSTPLGLAARRFRFFTGTRVPVYPSILQMRLYDMFAVSNRLTDAGIKKIRRAGASMEFDRIRHYIDGDDYRKINWKATARKRELMVNQYRDERSQRVYSLIDMGRVMKMPFRGMSLLDYAINAALVISNVAIRREDRAGVITFSTATDALLPASREHAQMFRILELLYNCRTGFGESNYELLCADISRKISRRSLMLLFTNFETLSSLRRTLPYLSLIARRHFLVVIFFVNTELSKLLDTPAASLEDIYIKTIAEKFSFEKKQVVKELERHGIHSILTSPESLTVDTINKYLELKTRGLI